MSGQLSVWRARAHTFDLSPPRTIIMGILNATPDSFSDGGRHMTAPAALAAAQTMIEDGADIIDVGGESTRPGRPETVTTEQECARVVPVIAQIRGRFPSAVISVDTYKGDVARQALEAGADIINDVCALRRSPEIAGMAMASGAGLILMHMRGNPETMQADPHYDDAPAEVAAFLRERMTFAVSHGVDPSQIAIDPGIGFGKTIEHNLELINRLDELTALGRPVCMGVSRKGFLGALTGGLPADQREETTIAAVCACVMNGARIVRVHNTRAAKRALAIIDALRAR
ncbi:MAG: dihydropteroate synthase [bacterium]